MEREPSTMQGRIEARRKAEEEALRQSEADAMEWRSGDLIAVKHDESGFILVRVLEEVDSGTAASKTTFQGSAYSIYGSLMRYRDTEVEVAVRPRDVLRPVKLLPDQTLPQTTRGWLQQHGGLPKFMRDSDDESDESSDDDDAGDDDDDDDAPKKSKKKPTTRRKKATNDDGDDDASPRKKRARSPKAPKAPKVKKEPKAKKAKPEPKPLVLRTDELFGASTELDPHSHKEAMRAALTDNVELFKKVLASESHVKWLDTNPRLATGTDQDILLAPAKGRDDITCIPASSIIVRRKNPAMLLLLREHWQKHEGLFNEKGTIGAKKKGDDDDDDDDDEGGEDEDEDNDKDKDKSIFESRFYVASDDAEASRPLDARIAAPDGSVLRRQQSGNPNFRMLGRAMRHVGAGRGGRELGNAFTATPDTVSGAYETLLNMGLDRASMSILTDGVSVRAGKALRDSLIDDCHMELAMQGDVQWLADALKDRMANGNATGPLHMTALDESTVAMPKGTLKASILKKGEESVTPLHYATLLPNTGCLKEMLDVVGPATAVQTTAYQGVTLLHFAVHNDAGNADAVRVILGVSENLATVATTSHILPIHYACCRNKAAAVTALLATPLRQQQLQAVYSGRTALHWAVTCGSLDAVSAILASAPDAKAKKALMSLTVKARPGVEEGGMSSLHLAAFNGDVEMVNLLLDNGASIDVRDRKKRTPLLIASKIGSIAVVSTLAHRGAKVDAADSSANQAIHYAAAYGHFAVLKYVIEECNADINAETAWKMTPIGLALLGGFSATCGKYLLGLAPRRPASADDDEDNADAPPVGVDVSFRDQDYNTLLMTTMTKDYDNNLPELLAHVKHFLAIGVDPTLQSADGSTVLHLLAGMTAGREQRAQLHGYRKTLEARLKALNALTKTSTMDDLAAAVIGSQHGSDDGENDSEEDEDEAEDEGGEEGSEGGDGEDEGAESDGEDEDDEAAEAEDDDDEEGAEEGDDDDDDDGEDDGEECGDDDDSGDDEDAAAGAEEDDDELGACDGEDEDAEAHGVSDDGEKDDEDNDDENDDEDEDEDEDDTCDDSFNGRWEMASRVEEWGIDRVRKELALVDKELANEDVEAQLVKAILEAARKRGGDAAVKAFVNVKTHEGQTATLLALIAGNFGVMRVLFENGADSTLVDKQGRNVLHHIFSRVSLSSNPQMDEAQFGAHLPTMLNQRDSHGLSPVHTFALRVAAVASKNSNANDAANEKLAALMTYASTMFGRFAVISKDAFTAQCGPFTLTESEEKKTTNADPVFPELPQAFAHFSTDSETCDVVPSSELELEFEAADKKRKTEGDNNNNHNDYYCYGSDDDDDDEDDEDNDNNAGGDGDVKHAAGSDVPLRERNKHHWFGGFNVLHFLLSAPVTASNFTETLMKAVAKASPQFVSAVSVRGATPLHRAAVGASTPAHTALLQKVLALPGAAASAKVADETGLTPLLIAARDGSLSAFNVLLPKSDVNASNEAGVTSAHFAAAHRNLELLEVISKAAKKRIAAADKTGRTPLHYAMMATVGNTTGFDVESLLLQHCSVDTADTFGCTALHYCFCRANRKPTGDPIEVVGSVLAVSADAALLNAQDVDGHTALSYAARCGSLSSALLLGARGANWNIADTWGNTPLAHALLCDRSEFAVAVLQLRGRVDPNVNVHTVETSTDEAGKKITKVTEQATACGYAMRREWRGVVYMLLEAGLARRTAMLDGLNCELITMCENLLDKVPRGQEPKELAGADAARNGDTVLHALAHARSSSKKLYEAFVKRAKISINAVNSAGRTPAHACNGHLPTLRVLRQYNADLSVRCKNGTTAMSAFFANGALDDSQRAALQECFQKMSASPNFLIELPSVQKGAETVTPSPVTGPVKCLMAKDVRTLMVLIKAGSDLAARDGAGMTLMMHAVKTNAAGIVSILLKCTKPLGLDAKDSDGRTVLHHAVLANNTTVVKELLQDKRVQSVIDVQDKVSGATALHTAVQPLPFGSFNNGDIVSALLDAGAKTRVKNNKGATAMELTVPMASATLRNAFAAKKVAVPTMNRVSSVVPAAKWPTKIMDADKDATEHIAALDAASTKVDEKVVSAEERDDQIHPVDPVYLESQVEASKKPGYQVLHVWQQHDLIQTKVDVKYGTYGMNNFYRMQVLHDVLRGVWVLWTRYGRIGHGDGQYQATPFPTADEAVSEFRKVFKSKSGNDWDCRDDFVKMAGRYQYHPITEKSLLNMSEVLAPFTRKELSAKSGLDTRSQRLLQELTNITALTRGYRMTGVQDDAYPLGRVPRDSLDRALELLGKMRVELETTKKEQESDREHQQRMYDAVATLANEFYEIIPTKDYSHSRNAPPENAEEVAELWNKVSTMRDLDAASRVVLGARRHLSQKGQFKNPMEYVLASLGVSIAPLVPTQDADELAALKQYIHRTMCPEAKDDGRVHRIFRIQRRGEAERLEGTGVSNRQLLFHGSGSPNLLSILSQGLKVAPAEAPVTGYALGKGVYFADAAAKSFNYTYSYDNGMDEITDDMYVPTSDDEDAVAAPGADKKSKVKKPSKFMFMCEVALGKPHTMYEYKYVSKLPQGTQSVFASAQQTPDPRGAVVLQNGVAVPLGAMSTAPKPPQGTRRNMGEYNEYVVYNADQIRLRYLVQFRAE